MYNGEVSLDTTAGAYKKVNTTYGARKNASKMTTKCVGTQSKNG